MALVRIAWLLICGTLILVGQGSKETFSISGTVTDSFTGEPIRKAVVGLLGLPNRERATTISATGASGIAGEFQFHGLAKGAYKITAQKPGYADVGLWNGVDAEIGKSSVTGLNVRVSPLGSMRGTVTDQDGEPIRGARVVALHWVVNDGRGQYWESRNVSTDDRGEYGLWNLTPGKYLIRAEGRWGGTSQLLGDASSVRVLETFPSVYHDGSRELRTAKPIVMEHGARVEANFRVTLERAYRIRGTLAGASRGELIKFQLVRGEEVVSTNRAALSESSGRFEIYDVPSGNYVLRASMGNQIAEAPIVLGGLRNPAPVSLAFPTPEAATTQLLVRFQLEGGGDRPPTATELAHGLCSPALHPAGIMGSVRYEILTNSKGDREVLLTGIPVPSTFYFQTDCRYEGYVHSIRAGSVQLNAGAVLAFRPGVEPEPIDIVVRSGGGTLEIDCQVCSAKNAALVIAAPVTNPVSGISSVPCLDECSLARLAPGEYKVYTIPRDSVVEFRNPKALEVLQGSVLVAVEATGKKKLVIREFSK